MAKHETRSQGERTHRYPSRNRQFVQKTGKSGMEGLMERGWDFRGEGKEVTRSR